MRVIVPASGKLMVSCGPRGERLRPHPSRLWPCKWPCVLDAIVRACRLPSGCYLLWLYLLRLYLLRLAEWLLGRREER